MKRVNHYFQNSNPFRDRLSRYREIATRIWLNIDTFHVYEIYRRLEVDCGVISGRNVKTIGGYVVVNVEVASSSSFRDNREDVLTLKLAVALTTERPFGPHFRGNEAKTSNDLHNSKWIAETVICNNEKKTFRNRLSRYRIIATQTWPKIDTFVRFAADQN